MKNKLLRRIATVAGVLTMTCLVFGTSTKAYGKQLKTNVTITKLSTTTKGTKLQWKSKKKYDRYIVYRSVNNGTFKNVDYTSSLEYIDDDIETGEKYTYKIRPLKYKKHNKKAYGNYSYVSAEIVAKPLGVKDVSVVDFKDYKFVTWDLNDSASSYVLYRKKSGGKWKYITELADGNGSYKDYDASKSKKYQYRIAVVENINDTIYKSAYTKSSYAGNLKGIDVSYHNGTINWKKVKKAGISFAMIRLGYGTKKGGIVDKQLDYNYKNAKKNGIKIGLYLYSYADNNKEAKNEAKFTYKMLKSYGDVDYPIAFDFENGYRNKRKYKKSNTNIIKTYCDYLENKGYDTSVYSYMDFLKYSVYYKKISDYGVWLARWTHNTKNFYDGGIPNVQMWQYSDRGTVRGINSRVDLNWNIIK